MTCPKCGSSNTRLSRHHHRNGFLDRVRGRRAFRCRKCWQLFYAPMGTQSSGDVAAFAGHSRRPGWFINRQATKRLGRRLLFLSVFVVAFLIFLYFLRYLTTEPRSSNESAPASFHLDDIRGKGNSCQISLELFPTDRLSGLMAAS